jgi:hypothetical protein
MPNGGRRPGACRRDELECGGSGQPSTVPIMPSDKFVPVSFNPPSSLATNQFRLEPLGPQHNQADHAAWMSSIEHIRCTPGYPSASEQWDVTVQSWVRADRSRLDVPLADAVAQWLTTDWPWKRVDRCGR